MQNIAKTYARYGNSSPITYPVTSSYTR